jgi:hypothetical protein
MIKENEMKPRTPKAIVRNLRSGFLATLILCGLAAHAKLSGAQPTPKTFNTAEDAVQAFVKAAGTDDVPAMLEILGPDGRDLVVSEDPVQDKNRAAVFVALAQEKSMVTETHGRRADLMIGNDGWPFPIPMVKQNGKWHFDAQAGRQEILFRRIGENELSVIQICRGYVDAQLEYASTQHDGSGVNQYAQKIISSPGKQDGLAWKNPDGSWGGPVGEGAAKALEEGYTSKSQPYHGYYFKVLKGQGPAAQLGEMNFLVNGVMIGGFALAAAPAQYRVTGVKTFIVSQDGIVYQKDLGPNTLTTFANMELYNPDKTWIETDDEE